MLISSLVKGPRVNSIYALTVGLLLLLAPAEAQAQAAGKNNAGPATRRATGALKVVTGQPGSVVFINNVRHGATNDKGELDLPHALAGSYPVRVRTVGYADWNGPVVIAAGGSRTLKVTQQPTNDQATLHYQKADQLRDSGKNKDAVKEYEQALALRPAFPEARIALARSFTTLQNFQEAEKQIQSAIKIGGRTAVEAQTALANLRRQQGLVEESIVEYRKALRLARGNSFEAHIGLAIAFAESDRVDEAVKEYRIGIAQDMETEPILYYQLGELLEKANRNKEAIEAYRNYLRLDPEGEYASAVESIIERLKEGPDNR
ncbi:MAG TPA: tetratricopeptide repeat protein [Blastocatellia bacterium]|jgi:predicted Zn-dependent protease|nr:tetratricopeptide repeat protein [Blastocatellia bacterium]